MKRKSQPIEIRFWKKVTKSKGCWLWTGATNEDGYGIICENNYGRHRGAHRVSWELHFGPIPEGKSILHKCDNPPCTNPEHLFMGNQEDNIHDCVSKGRQRGTVGEKNHKAVLSDVIVMECRAAHKAGESIPSLAKKHGISRRNMWCAVTGRTWKHLP